MLIRTPKDTIIASFSAGESSAKMLFDILEKYSDTHRVIIPFANTGEENEQTLVFCNQVDEYIQQKYSHKVDWLQYNGYDWDQERHRWLEVNFKSAYRSHDPTEILLKWPNHPFRKMIEYFGIPNLKYKHCSRELKGEMIKRWLRDRHGIKEGDYTIATGIRADEIDRLNEIHWHPLAIAGVTKPHVNVFWKDMPFRLQLKGFEGNCKVCWKKSDRKLCTLYRQDPTLFGPFDQFQKEYENYEPPRGKGKRKRKKLTEPLRFFRGNKTVDDIADMSKLPFPDAEDDSVVYNVQTGLFDDLDNSNGCDESCEAF